MSLSSESEYSSDALKLVLSQLLLAGTGVVKPTGFAGEPQKRSPKVGGPLGPKTQPLIRLPFASMSDSAAIGPPQPQPKWAAV